MGKLILRDAREKEEFEAGGGGGDSIDLGIELGEPLNHDGGLTS